MSDTDSFIEEVTEEVRRDRLFLMMRRYGWIAILAVLLLVGGAAYNEYRKSQARVAAQNLGDSIITALEGDAPADRAAALQAISTENAGGQAVLRLLTANELVAAGQSAEAATAFEAIATDADLPEIYRQIASYKALVQRGKDTDIATRRTGFEALATPGSSLRLLAEEQLALIALESGDADDAITRLQAIIVDSEVTPGLRQRASQLIVALGGTPQQVAGG